MSQIDDLRARIDRALEEVEQVTGSLKEIDALKSALGDANSRLRDNADQLGELAQATETFRRAVERATKVLASIAEELSAADAVQIGNQISRSETNLKGTIESSSSALMGQVGKAQSEILGQVSAGLGRLESAHDRLSNDVRSEAAKLTALIETRSRASARSRRRWMVALVGVNLISASAVAAVVVWVFG